MSRRLSISSGCLMRRATTSSKSARSQTVQTLLAQLISRRSYVSKQKEEDDGSKLDFKGQLWESTTQRVQKERQDQERFARNRIQRGTGRGAAGLAFTATLLMASGWCYYLGTIKIPSTSTASTLPLSTALPPVHDTSTPNLQAAWTDLKNIVGIENISTDEDNLVSHSGSAWSSHPALPGDRPFAIVQPGSTADVSAIMKVCHSRRIPVTAYSGGTSLEGHFAATRGGICIDFSRMDNILKIHADDMDCVVQPSVGWETLDETLAEQGLFFPPDPGPGAMIGGMVGTGCSGTNAYRYGTMKDWVISLTVVLADGTIIKTRQRPRKSSAGYDLTRTFIGSEGTLGLVTEATLKVTSKPQNPRVAVCTFSTIREAADCAQKVVRAGIPIAAVELLDDVQMRVINESGGTQKQWKEAPTLFFKFSGTSPAAVKESIVAVQKTAKASGSRNFEFARDEAEGAELWSARKDALTSMIGRKKSPSDHVWTTDVAVPMTALPAIIEETKADIAKSGLLASIVGHVGDGNFHAIVLYNDKERQVADDLVHRMVKRAIEMEGTATGEHGVGLVKRDYLEHELGQDTVDAMRMLKRAFDPLCLLNCDKIVRSQVPEKGEVMEW